MEGYDCPKIPMQLKGQDGDLTVKDGKSFTYMVLSCTKMNKIRVSLG